MGEGMASDTETSDRERGDENRSEIVYEFEHHVLFHSDGGYVDQSFDLDVSLESIVSTIRGSAYEFIGPPPGVSYEDIRVDSVTIEDGVVSYRVHVPQLQEEP